MIKKLQVLGIYFELELRISTQYKNYLEKYNANDTPKQRIIFELKNPVADFERSEMTFYTTIFYDKVLEILKFWKNSIPQCNFNKFMIKDQKIPIKAVYKQPNMNSVKTNKKCSSCETEMIIRTNMKNDRKFYACPKCSKTKNIEYNYATDKKGWLLYINPKLLCSLPIEKINCIIVSNLVSTYKIFGSAEYWIETIKYCPDFISVCKPHLDVKLKKALEEALKQMIMNDKENENKYQSILKCIGD